MECVGTMKVALTHCTRCFWEAHFSLVALDLFISPVVIKIEMRVLSSSTVGRVLEVVF